LANTQSAQKRMRQERKHRIHNRAQRTRIRSAIKKVSKATDAATGSEALKEAYAILDRMACRKQIHRNKAARKKSQLARAVASLA
jgi:small subunit ribosomal protein S20